MTYSAPTEFFALIETRGWQPVGDGHPMTSAFGRGVHVRRGDDLFALLEVVPTNEAERLEGLRQLERMRFLRQRISPNTPEDFYWHERFG